MPNNKCVGGHSAGRKLQILVGGQEVGVHVKMRVVETTSYTAAIRTLRIQDLS
jgi:hypothetical protein